MPGEEYIVYIIKLLKNHPSTTSLAGHSNFLCFSGRHSRHHIIPFQYSIVLMQFSCQRFHWKGRNKREAGAVEKCDTWVINLCSTTPPSAHLDSRILGLEWAVGLAAWLLGHSSPSVCQMGPGATGGVSQVVGPLVPDIDFNLSPFCRRPREYLSHLGLCPIIIPERKGRD
jgi:hypothetical protein